MQRNRKPNSLNPKQLKFIEEYLKHGNGAEAVRQAGYSLNKPDGRAWELLQLPQIQEQIELHRKAVAKRTEYNLQKAMEETDRAIAFAIETENANAYVKAVEHKAKLNGLMVEKHDVRQVGFSVQIIGVDFNKGRDTDE